jgi:hypothetical protein
MEASKKRIGPDRIVAARQLQKSEGFLKSAQDSGLF